MHCSYEEHAAPALFFERRAVDGVIIHWSRELARIVWRLAMWLLLCSIAVMVARFKIPEKFRSKFRFGLVVAGIIFLDIAFSGIF